MSQPLKRKSPTDSNDDSSEAQLDQENQSSNKKVKLSFKGDGSYEFELSPEEDEINEVKLSSEEDESSEVKLSSEDESKEVKSSPEEDEINEVKSSSEEDESKEVKLSSEEGESKEVKSSSEEDESSELKSSSKVDEDDYLVYDYENTSCSDGIFISSQDLQTVMIATLNDSQIIELNNNETNQINFQIENQTTSPITFSLNSDQLQQICERTENLNKLLADLNSLKELLNNHQHNKSIGSFSLKDHQLPTKKGGSLFTNDDLINQERMKDNFINLLKRAIAPDSDVIHLLDENDRKVIQKFLKLTAIQQQVYVLLFLKKSRWTLVESINLSQVNDLVALLENLKLSDFLLSSDDFTSLRDCLSLLDKDQMSSLMKNCKLTQQKSKTANIVSVLKFVKDSNTMSTKFFGISLEANKLKFVKNQLRQKIYRLNPEKVKVFLKVLTTSFEPIAFDKDICHYYSTLLSSINDHSFAQRFPTYEKNQTIRLYENADDLNRFVNSCLTELDLNENNYDDLLSCISGVLNDLENCLNTNYDKDYYGLPDFLKRFTCIGRLTTCLKLCNQNLATDQEVKEDTKESIKEQLNNLIKQLDFESVNEELMDEKLIDIQLKTVDLDITQDFKVKKMSDDKKKTDKQIEEEIVIDEIMKIHNLETALKNQCYLFDNLFFSLFYDVIFDQTIENAFIYDFQRFPLDMNSSAFYLNRSEQFQAKIQTFELEKRSYLIKVLMNNRKNKCLKFISKSYTINNDALKDLLNLIKKDVLLSIMRRLIVDYNSRKYTCTNLVFYDMEDLTDQEKLSLKFVELKVNDDSIDLEKDRMFKYLSSLDLNVEIYKVKNKKTA